MNKKEKIIYEIDKTLGLFDTTESLPHNPYLYTRIQQRLNENSKRKFTFYNVLKPAFFTALLALNLTTAIWYTSSDNIAFKAESDLEFVDILKSDLNLESELTDNLLFE